MTQGSVAAVGVLHPGQMGAAVAVQALGGGARVLWCSAGRSPATARRAADAGLDAVADLEALLAQCQIVLSICPPAAAEDLAGEVAGAGFDGVFVEANAVCPTRVARIAERIEAAGARFIDAAVIGPPPSAAAHARLYLAGESPDVERVSALFARTAVETVSLAREAGAASALKMAFASYQKATRTLAAVAHALAERHGVRPELLAEAHRMASHPLAEPDYLPSVAARAWRWAPEMLEVADTLAADDLPGDLARATAAVLSYWEAERDRWGASLSDVLERLVLPAGPRARRS